MKTKPLHSQSVREAVMYVHSHNLYFIHETGKSQTTSSPAPVWVPCPRGLLSSNGPSASASPSSRWLSEYFGAVAFNGVQVIRCVGYPCEQKAMWELCLRFHLLLKPLDRLLHTVPFAEDLVWWDELLLIINTWLYWHFSHVFSVLLKISPLPVVVGVFSQ